MGCDMKKILFGLLTFLFPLMFVCATDISNIDMDIYVDLNGDALVTETWNANVTDGTEGYHPYFNIGNATISDLTVSMDGKEFTTIDNWDINRSFSEKSNKAGFYYTGNEIDICFGVTDYGNHTYTMKYKINGFVSRTTDADMIYWTLFPYDFSASPDNVHIKIYSDNKYNDNLDVWGYGNYGGTAYVYDGYIEMNSDGNLDSDEYMTILVKFPINTFNTTNILDNNFDYYYKMAEEGTTHYKDNTNYDFSIFFSFLVNIIVWLVIFMVIFKSAKKSDNYRFGTTGNKVRKDVPNFRDIPCNKDIYRAYFVAEKYNLNKKKEDLLGAILLKWLRQGNVRVEKIENKGIFKNKIENNIIFLKNPDGNELELKLYNWMVTASKDGKLESNEFKKWCSSNYDKILKWFDDVIDYEKDILINEGKIKTVEETKAKIFKTTYYDVDPSMMIEAEQMQGLKNYLKEFTLIKEREPIEVALWDEYLIYAQIFGIAEEVANQFKKLYPEITENMNNLGYDYSDFVFIYALSNSGISSANSARSRAQSYSSGGGGFSSGGGGGGSFGGGGGGGGFR